MSPLRVFTANVSMERAGATIYLHRQRMRVMALRRPGESLLLSTLPKERLFSLS